MTSAAAPTCTDLCPDGCCAGETCLAGASDDACGTGGAPCQSCSGDTPICFAGACACGDVCATGCRYPTIQAAIDDDDGPATIRLCAQTYPERIAITRDLTLLGAGQGAGGTTLDGELAGRVVRVQSGRTVGLQALRITNGETDLEGGGILNAGNLTLTDCAVTGNTATDGEGGGINNNDGTLTLTGCTVSNNVAGNGGGIYNDFNDMVMLTDCTVSDNTATDSEGGGIDNREGGTVNLSNTSVTGNTAGLEGGGIDNHGSGGTVNLTNGSSVANNTNGNCDGPGSYTGSGCA